MTGRQEYDRQRTLGKYMIDLWTFFETIPKKKGAGSVNIYGTVGLLTYLPMDFLSLALADFLRSDRHALHSTFNTSAVKKKSCIAQFMIFCLKSYLFQSARGSKFKLNHDLRKSGPESRQLESRLFASLILLLLGAIISSKSSG
jgi:hypothetical protein